ncbi:MAG: hypothetical protein H8D45_11335 [Bacteroidetes bacterium]|nr:hypothetical protein [Bacteroidota bacterium]MBL7105397.1 hypothetical protein [Bacteroidales bacterium]
MTNITYLIGAGASCGIRDDNASLPNYSMPFVKEIPARLELMIYILEQAKESVNNSVVDGIKLGKGLQKSYHEVLEELIQKFNIFKENVKSHASIDTYAKKIYFTDKPNSNGIYEKYEEVKALIELYFLFEHYFVHHDIRYDLFLASILKGSQGGNIKLPKSINIISWNYDFQFEASLANFFHTDRLKELRNNFDIYPGREKDITPDELDEFKFIHLNGVSGAFYNENQKSRCKSDDILLVKNIGNFNISEIIKAIEDKNENIVSEIKNISRLLLPIINTIIDKYAFYSVQKKLSSIKFAWELEDLRVSPIDYKFPFAKIVLKQTDILVIIGYSFPTFNRKIDKMIFKNLGDYVTIYLQVPDFDYNPIKTKINSLSFSRFSESINQIDIMNEFFIPYEFVG